MAQLEPCPTCTRHLRVSSASCPFCDTALPVEFRAPPVRALPLRGVSRATLFAIGAALATTASAGCYLSHELGGSDSRVDAGGFAPPYGIAPFDGGRPSEPDAGPPVAEDAGSPTAVDAGVDCACTAVLYGAAP